MRSRPVIKRERKKYCFEGNAIEHNLLLFDNMGPPDEQYNIECRITIQTTMDPSHNESKPGVRVVINFYTREDRSDRACWRLGPLTVGS